MHIHNAPWAEFTPRSSINDVPDALPHGDIVVFELESECQCMKKPPTLVAGGLFVQCG